MRRKTVGLVLAGAGVLLAQQTGGPPGRSPTVARSAMEVKAMEPTVRKRFSLL